MHAIPSLSPFCLLSFLITRPHSAIIWLHMEQAVTREVEIQHT
jgi:hypothetical protein